jgi:outer membrane protein assembly factor BamD (BamD/ComL family)
MIGLVTCLLVIIVFVVISILKSQTITQENKLYSEALKIKNSDTLNPEDKISQLEELNKKKGLSSIIYLYTASLYFENDELKKAQEAISKFSSSDIKLINDEKKLLEAEIMAATKKERQALDILNKMLSDSKCEITKDYILIKIAKIQIRTAQTKAAETNLKRLMNEYPQSFYLNKARSLLDSL